MGTMTLFSPDIVFPDLPTYVVIDVETTGVNPHKDAIVQLSAIRFEGEDPVDEFNTYINPLRPIPAEATQIHGITDDMVRDAPTISDVRQQFLHFIDDAILLGYNVFFDLHFLDVAFHGELDETNYIDVLSLAQKFLDLPDYRLETVASHLGISPAFRHHDSFADCQVTAAAFFTLIHLLIQSLEKSFHATKPNNTRSKRPPSAGFKVSEVAPTNTAANTEHPLYGKTIVFTGELSISRQEAAQLAVNVGAVVKSAVSRKTDYLVVGAQDIALVGDDGMSKKEEKAYELNATGKASIKIIKEHEFLAIVEGRSISNERADDPVRL